MAKEQVIEAIERADAVKFGEFELSSGMKSDYYVDKYKFETKPSPLGVIATEIADQVTTKKLGGVALGAVPLVTAVSLYAELPYVIVRKAEKEYGTNKRIEGDLSKGEEVVVIEDIATTGSSALEAVKALRKGGAKVERVVVVVDRQQGADELLRNHGALTEANETSYLSRKW